MPQTGAPHYWFLPLFEARVDSIGGKPEMSLRHNFSRIPEREFVAPVVGFVEQFDGDRLPGEISTCRVSGTFKFMANKSGTSGTVRIRGLISGIGSAVFSQCLIARRIQTALGEI